MLANSKRYHIHDKITISECNRDVLDDFLNHHTDQMFITLVPLYLFPQDEVHWFLRLFIFLPYILVNSIKFPFYEKYDVSECKTDLKMYVLALGDFVTFLQHQMLITYCRLYTVFVQGVKCICHCVFFLSSLLLVT